MAWSLPPIKQGLYDPQFEKDSCGVGFVVNVDGTRSNQIVHQALEVLDESEPPRSLRLRPRVRGWCGHHHPKSPRIFHREVLRDWDLSTQFR